MSFYLWRKYIATQTQCDFQVTEHPLTASFRHPGLNHASFNRHGEIDVLSLLSVTVDARIFAEKYQVKEGDLKWFQWYIEEGSSIFISSVKLAYSRNMHNKQVPKWPLDVKVKLGYIGNSSVAIVLELYNPGGKEPLLIQTVQLVTVDTKTRRPKTFPDWFLNKYRDQCLMKEGFRLHRFSRPKDTFVYQREIRWLDTDMNNHTNFAFYVRYAIDGLYTCLWRQSNQLLKIKTPPCDSTSDPNKPCSGSEFNMAEIGKSKCLPGNGSQTSSGWGGLDASTKDLLQEGFKSLEICYLNECVEGDIVDVHIWKEVKEPYHIRCSIEKGPKTLCQIVFEYFTPLTRL